MCGIAGFYNYSQQHIDNPEGLVKKMLATLTHRGPDDEGCFIHNEDGIYLGHKRLSIIDLSLAGHQPMLDNNSNAIVFNGEIYNYQEISKKHNLTELYSTSDTEILLKRLTTSGVDAINELNGMFAFAHWNSEKKKLLLARDHVGEKPLYYCTTNGIFSFASEIRALLELPWVKRELDEKALYHFLTFSNLHPPQTLFKNIHKFHPAHFMQVTTTGIETYKAYWEVEYNYDSLTSEQNWLEVLQSQTKQSVSSRLISDTPIGIFLSGGVDSSAIVAQTSSLGVNNINTFTIGFEGASEYNELVYAEKIAKQFNTNHHVRIIHKKEIQESIHLMANAFDEPLADPPSIPIYYISQLSQQHNVKVILTGDGPDELFSGYTGNWQKYADYYPYYNAYKKTPRFIKSMVTNMYALKDTSSPLYELLERAKNNEEFFWGGANSFKENQKRTFLSDEFIHKVQDLNSHAIIQEYKKSYDSLVKKYSNRNWHSVDWMCYLGFKGIIPNYYMLRGDRLGMQSSVEIRSPFLDKNMVNLALSMPYHLKVKDNVTKYLFKKSLEDKLPRDILYRDKRGFNVPMKEWLLETIVPEVERNLHLFCKETALFKYETLKSIINNTKAGNTNHTRQLWLIYFLMHWYKRWM